jgi:YVTN family beta-propeller protein
MRGGRLGRWRLALVMALLAALLGTSGGEAGASTTFSQLPLNGFRSIVVDDATGHVFVSGSPARADASVAVAGFDGGLVKLVSGIPGASGLVRDGDRVYVAECGAGQVSAIDTATLGVTETIDSGATIGGSCEIATAGGRLWFVSDSGLLASVSEAAPHVSASYAALGAFTRPLITAGGSRLVLADTDVDISQGGVPAVRVYDVSQGTPQLEVSGYPDLGGYGIRNFVDASMSADGSTLLLSTTALVQVDPTDLSVSRIFTANIRGTQVPVSDGAAEVTPSGLYTGATSGTSAYSWFTTGPFVRATNVRTVSRPGSFLYPRGVALSADGRRLFAIGGNDGYPENKDAYLWTIDGPALASTTLTLVPGRHWISAGETVRLTAHLSHFASDSLIRIYANPTGLDRRLVASGHPNASGNLSVLVRPLRNTSYDAESPSGLSYASAATGRQYVFVRAQVTSTLTGYYGTSRGYRLYHYTTACRTSHRGCPTVVARVWPNHAGKWVSVDLQVLVSGRWQAVFSDPFKLNSRSRTTVLIIYGSTSVIGHRFRILTSFGGDADHRPGRSGWSHFRITR